MRLKYLRGNATAEFILVLPVVVMFMMAIVDYSVIFYDQAVLKNTSIKAVRYGIVQGNPTYLTTTAVSTYAKNYCSGALISFVTPAPTVTVTVTQTESTPKFGDTLTVTLSYTYTRISYMTTLGFSSTVTLTATTSSTYE